MCSVLQAKILDLKVHIFQICFCTRLYKLSIMFQWNEVRISPDPHRQTLQWRYQLMLNFRLMLVISLRKFENNNLSMNGRYLGNPQRVALYLNNFGGSDNDKKTRESLRNSKAEKWKPYSVSFWNLDTPYRTAETWYLGPPILHNLIISTSALLNNHTKPTV